MRNSDLGCRLWDFRGLFCKSLTYGVAFEILVGFGFQDYYSGFSAGFWEFFRGFQSAFGIFFRFFGPQVVSVGRRVTFRFSVGFQDFSGFQLAFGIVRVFIWLSGSFGFSASLCDFQVFKLAFWVIRVFS